MRKIYPILLIFVGACLLSCSNNPPTGSPQGRLQVYLQDSPVLFDSVFVNIKQIALRSTMQYPDSVQGWNMIFNTPTSFDVLKYRNGHRGILFNQNVPVGTYEPLRIIFGACTAVRHDTIFSLGLTHAADTIAYANGFIRITKNDTIRTLVDIDLISSIIYNTDSLKYFFNPHFTFIDLDSTGYMFGTIVTPATILLFPAGNTDTLTFTVTDPLTNNFGFYGLRQGFYDISITPRDTSYDSLVVENIAIYPNSFQDFGNIDLAHH
jgi:hypothetical protein